MSLLMFVTPAWKRYDLSEVCFEQRRRVIESLAQQGIEARCVVVADDRNLDIARSLGFDTVRQNNDWLGRKFNDGIEYACRNGATWSARAKVTPVAAVPAGTTVNIEGTDRSIVIGG